MKKKFVIFSIACLSMLFIYNVLQADIKLIKGFPSDDKYTKEWKTIDSLVDYRLPESAGKILDQIYNHAKTSKNDAQVVKSLIYKIKLSSYKDEESLVKSIYRLEEEAAKAEYPLKPLIHSILAEAYWEYYQDNRWRIFNRSETVNFKQDDVRTWSLGKITEAIIRNYQSSVEDPDKLRKYPMKQFDDLLYQYKYTRHLRPTLHDFNAHRAIDFFKNREPAITYPAYKFELKGDDYFKSTDEFIKLDIPDQDTITLRYHAITMLQDLEAYYSSLLKSGQDSAIYPLLDVNFKRLNFVKEYSSASDRDSLYVNAMRAISNKFPKNAEAARARIYVAKFYMNSGSKYNAWTNKTYKWWKKKADNIAIAVEKEFPKTHASSNAKGIQRMVRSKALSLKSEKNVIPNQDFKSFVTYKNLDTVYCRIVKTSIKDLESIQRRYDIDESIKHFRSKSAYRKWTQILANDGDFQSHTTEIPISKISEPGIYVLMMSTSPKMEYEKNTCGFHIFNVTNLTYINRHNSKEFRNEYRVLFRESGEPVAGAKAQLYVQEYNQLKRRYVRKKDKIYTSNSEGYFEVPQGDKYKNYTLEVSHKDDIYYNESYEYLYRKYEPTKTPRTRTTFFLDRGIYRPGQTIYYKGIMIQTDYDGENPRILKNQSTTVTFYDANWQQVSTASLTTNEYGTFSGTFTAPVGRLTGNMHIENGYGSQYFSVEEYKRPKFETSFKPVENSYRVNDSVSITGHAKALAGFNIDGAKVSYRITRKASYPDWYYWWYWAPPNRSTVEIGNGEMKTDEKGEYTIKFKAIPDGTISPESEPVFNYTITADITDLNGETRSATSTVRIGYTTMSLSNNLPKALENVGSKKFKVFTRNLTGADVEGSGDLTISRLQPPAEALRKKRWERSDFPLISKADYKKNYPNDEVDIETKFSTWKKAQSVFNLSFNTKDKKEYEIKNLKSWKPGVYVVEMKGKDPYGQNVKSIKYITIYSKKSKELPYPNYDWFHTIKAKGEPGETAEYLIGASKKTKILYEIEHKNKIVSKKWVTVNNSQTLIQIPIEEKHRGNVAVHFTFVRDNRVYKHDGIISVPRTNKQLDIEFETFRNKLLPGQAEEWKLKIKGKNGDKVAAEFVASLYDASLDQFRSNSWYVNIYKTYYSSLSWRDKTFQTINARFRNRSWFNSGSVYEYSYDHMRWFGFYNWTFDRYYSRRYRDYDEGGEIVDAPLMLMEEASEEEEMDDNFADEKSVSKNLAGKKKEERNADPDGGLITDGEFGPPGDGKGKEGKSEKVQIRKNFNETAFFLPHLKTDGEGNIIVKFTIPEALTKWKMLGFAHTQDLASGYATNELVTQKEIMVNPFAPRFFREGDQIVFTTKVSNVSEADVTGSVELKLFNALNMKEITSNVGIKNGSQSVTIKKGQSVKASWKMNIPDDVQAITYRLIAKAGKHSDGEEMVIPVMTNRMLVTESMPLPIRGISTKNFKFTKLLNNKSKTLKHHKLTLEFTSNPAWYAVQALPYLIEYPYECLEQTYSRYYANSIASHIANSSPKIKAVFDSWKNLTPDALLSNLEKNQELKQLMLEETPWVLNAKSESERKKRIALLFDLNRMGNEMGRALMKLKRAQLGNGGYAWFEGGPDDRYITQHITCGFGKMNHLKIKHWNESDIKSMSRKGVKYCDDRIREDYEELLRLEKKGLIKLSDDHLGYHQIHYLYTRSFYDMKEIPMAKRNTEAYDYYMGQAEKYWNKKGKYAQGMIALALHRLKEEKSKVPGYIVKSFRETALHNDEMGMYWKEMTQGGYYWWQAPIESEALMIEVFNEVADDEKAVDDMKVWLIKNKQTNDWKTTKATVEACYALLLRGESWLVDDQLVEITIGDKVIDPLKLEEVKVEAGTGYFKTSWSGGDINQNMGNVTVNKKTKGVAWGAVYWQYFEQLDKITPAETPLKLKKQVFLERKTPTGPVIEPVTEKTRIKIGDRLKVRIELRSDRQMEYIHMKDMRASGLEPENVMSRYKWQDGLGYYEATKHASTNFFITYLPKGTFVFEYPLRVTHEGDFSNGITTIQCMYAPEFTSHSEGIRLKIKDIEKP